MHHISSVTVIPEIQFDIKVIEDDTSLYVQTNFDSRADALDFIDFHIIDRIEGLLQSAEAKERLEFIKQHAEKIKGDLEEVDCNMFKQLREKISMGIYTGTWFKEMIAEYTRYDLDDLNQPDQIGYNNLDAFINGLLSDQEIPEATLAREPEMVFYQKAPARIIFQLVEQARLKQDDVFFDLGSGLGQVTILVNLISGATAKGIEYEPAYCNYARACVSQLNLSNIEFINADARKGDYAEGTVFFLYTPFEGFLLQDMLNILQKESQKRTIRIFTYGPCSSPIARQSWLNCVNGKADDPYSLCEFISLVIV